MRVRIVCYEDVHSWILGKFALKMQENLTKMGISVDIAKRPDPEADINHHIIYTDFECRKNSIDTLMITHIDDISKRNLLFKQLEFSELGICMSNETMINLSNLGIPREKLCYVNPAHDGIISPRKNTIGIACRVQPDGRKREKFLSSLSKDISPKIFSFKIMGDGWDKQVADLENRGFLVEYTNHFIYEKYIELIPSLDYYLYMGQDEGQMGFVDALAAGVDTIVTPQGYHLDAPGGITYPFNTYDELLSVFKQIESRSLKLANSVSTWNWYDYTKKHFELWDYLLCKKRNVPFKYLKSDVEQDGINSVEEFSDKKPEDISFIKRNKMKFKLTFNRFLHSYNYRKTIYKV